MTLIPVIIPIRDAESEEVLGEKVSEHFAITPPLITLPDGSIGYADHGRVLTHIPTGRAITHSSWVDYRVIAARLEAVPLDWDSDKPFGQIADAEREAVKAALMDPDEKRDGWPWPKWAGDISHPALSLMGTQLDDAVRHGHERWQYRRDTEAEVAKFDAELGKRIGGDLLAAQCAEEVAEYGLIYLLAVLHRIDPKAADLAARDLVGAWDAGDSMGEWLHQWRQELADGRPLTLHGFPDVALPATDSSDV